MFLDGPFKSMSFTLEKNFLDFQLMFLSQNLEKDHLQKQYYNSCWRENKRLNIFKNLIEGQKIETFIDLGSRDGYVTQQLLTGDEQKVTCVDGDAHALHLCKERLGMNTQILHSDLNHPLHLENNYYDMVFSGETIEHLYNPENLIKEAQKILKPCGIFIGSTPNALQLEKRFFYLFGYDPKDFSDTMHLQYFSKKSLKKLLQRHFQNVELYSYTNHFTIKYFSHLIADGFIWLCKK